MVLSIKDEETNRLARTLAQRNGETVTMAVKIAVKERLERQEQSRKPAGRFERIRRIVEQTAPLMNDGRTSKELMDELYDDETGLPK
ncbi:MAG: type II toxin-antitoxin system VapB family antitoxin [Acidobacteriota bacterium]|nr:type II toxin-antitoxin system VapB family antitoxin [Acidobacteriota bacterium]